MIHNLRLVKAAQDPRRNTQSKPGGCAWHLKQMAQIEFLSKAGEPHPCDTISKRLPRCVQALLCQAAAPEPAAKYLPLAINHHHCKAVSCSQRGSALFLDQEYLMDIKWHNIVALMVSELCF